MTALDIKRSKYYQKKYDINLAQYNVTLALQCKKCAICLKEPKEGRRLAVDHDHRTGRVRGLCCFRCNKFRIGRAHAEDAVFFRRVADYLESTFDARKL